MTFYLNHLINLSIILLSSPTHPIFLTLAGLVYLLSQFYTILPHLIYLINFTYYFIILINKFRR